jgi:hypothetical protein
MGSGEWEGQTWGSTREDRRHHTLIQISSYLSSEMTCVIQTKYFGISSSYFFSIYKNVAHYFILEM